MKAIINQIVYDGGNEEAATAVIYLAYVINIKLVLKTKLFYKININWFNRTF